jgi:hypothetical protein
MVVSALETVIGLALLFGTTAALTAATVEGASRLLRKRARWLDETIGQMLGGSSSFDHTAREALHLFQGTSVHRAATAASNRGRRFRTEAGPAYLSARSFADAIDELADELARRPAAGLRDRLGNREIEGGRLTLESRAALEGWYDETMARLGEAYRRWATTASLAVGLVLACAGNVSVFHTARVLWQEPVGEPGLPAGWGDGTDWSNAAWVSSHVAGWLVTALLLMLGAPWWFDALSRLAPLRATGTKPPLAADDPASATSLRASAVSAVGSATIRHRRAEAASGRDDTGPARGVRNPGGQQMTQPGPTPSTRRALAALGLSAMTAVVGTVLMLRLKSTDFNIVGIAGVAGAASSSVALLLRRGGLPRFTRTVASNGSLAVVGPVVGGLFAGAASLLLAVALLDPEPSLPSSAVFGGLSGLVLGGWVNQALTPRPEDLADGRLAPAAVEEVVSFWRRRYNYKGRVLLEAKTVRRTGLHLSTLSLTFVPDSVRVDQHADTAGPVRVEDGTDAGEVPFEIAILSTGAVDAYPRSLAVKVPADRASDPVEFTLTLPAAGTDSGAADSPAGTVLVDISQAGRSLQLLEIGSALWNASPGPAPGDRSRP